MNKSSFLIPTLFLFNSLSILAADTTWTGVISDSMCGKDHSMMAQGSKKVDPRSCAQACVKGGSKYVLVASGKVLEIQNQALPALKEHAGHTVKVSGTASSDGKSIKVSQVTMPTKKK
ncbi:MAG TPA: hypothetical protein VGK99_03235 [Acidobacteriota bacterium]